MTLKRPSLGLIALLVAAVGSAIPRSPPAQAATPRPTAPTASSLMIVENAGQFDPAVRFQARWGGLTFWVTDTSLGITRLESAGSNRLQKEQLGPDARAVDEPRPGVNLEITFPGSRPSPPLVASDPRPTKMNYFLGSDPGRWRSGVRTYGAVTWHGLYPGVSVTLTEAGGEPALVVLTAPGADLAGLRLRVAGAEALQGAPDGRLVAETPIGPARLPAVLHHGRPAQARVGGNEVSFTVSDTGAGPLAAGEVSETPTGKGLHYGTFLGGGLEDISLDVALGEDGSTYITGLTYSPDFPTTQGAFDTTYGDEWDIFVSKLNPTASTLVFSTFLGGESADIQATLAVGVDGGAYVAGRTTSPDFPTTPGAYDGTYDPGNGFITRLDPTGAILAYSTFLGAGLNMADLGLASDGTVYVTGETSNPDHPTTPGAFDQIINNDGLGLYTDAFLTALNAAGSDLVYSTFLGGSYNDDGFGVIVGPDGTAYVTGEAHSFDFPTTPGAFDETGGGQDGFVTVFEPTGSSLVFSTYLGGSDGDAGRAVALDALGNVYVVGETSSPDFPTTPGAYDTTINSYVFPDAFATKLTQDGSALLYSTFLGGNESDFGRDLSLGPDGSVTLTGTTYSANFPTTPWAFDRTLGGSADAFVARFAPTGGILTYGSFLGGTSRIVDQGYGIAPAGRGAVAVVGTTNSGDFPVTPGAFDPTYNGGGDGFVAVLRVAPTMHVERIVPGYRDAGSGYRVGAAVQIEFPDGAPVSGADVTVEVAYPDGTEVVVTDSTGSRGVAAVVASGSDSGTYTFTVLAVTRPGVVYDPSQNVETTDSVMIPGTL